MHKFLYLAADNKEQHEKFILMRNNKLVDAVNTSNNEFLKV